MRERFQLGRGRWALWVLAAVWTHPALAEEKTSPDAEATFDMRELSVFSLVENPDRGIRGDLQRLTMGQYAKCETEPGEEVKAYPPLKSKRPYYGAVTLARDPFVPGSGVEYQFVVDESGEDQSAWKEQADQPEEKEEQSDSLLDRLAAALSGAEKRDLKREEEVMLAGLSGTYDRLYFDLNRDLDLTNDPVLMPLKSPPPAAVPRWNAKQKIVFDYLSVPFDYGPEIGVKPYRILPRFLLRESEGEQYAYLYLAATTAREGRIRIGSRQYDAVMGQPHLITGRFDRPFTALYLSPVDDPSQREYWWGSDELSAFRRVDGEYFTTSTTPTGDKLLVKRYQGELGVLKLGAGGRKLDKLGISGSLRSASGAVAVGNPSSSSPSLEEVQNCTLPVGDYMPYYVHVEFGTLRIGISNNYHSDGIPRDMDRKRVRAIKIRNDKPFVWDFSNKPEVIFPSPAKDATFAPGDEISVNAVLTDPVLDIMIRDLDDTSRKEKKTIDVGEGRTSTYESPLSLDPTVTITNSAGETVAEGTMPFG